MLIKVYQTISWLINGTTSIHRCGGNYNKYTDIIMQMQYDLD